MGKRKSQKRRNKMSHMMKASTHAEKNVERNGEDTEVNAKIDSTKNQSLQSFRPHLGIAVKTNDNHAYRQRKSDFKIRHIENPSDSHSESARRILEKTYKPRLDEIKKAPTTQDTKKDTKKGVRKITHSSNQCGDVYNTQSSRVFIAHDERSNNMYNNTSASTNNHASTLRNYESVKNHPSHNYKDSSKSHTDFALIMLKKQINHHIKELNAHCSFNRERITNLSSILNKTETANLAQIASDSTSAQSTDRKQLTQLRNRELHSEIKQEIKLMEANLSELQSERNKMFKLKDIISHGTNSQTLKEYEALFFN